MKRADDDGLNAGAAHALGLRVAFPDVAEGRGVNAALAVQAYVLAHHGQVEEVEINPLICTPTRAVAADVLIKTGEPDD